ncbi:MAG: M36 family metallopeptidase [Pseudomonadota bacterium]
MKITMLNTSIGLALSFSYLGTAFADLPPNYDHYHQSQEKRSKVQTLPQKQFILEKENHNDADILGETVSSRSAQLSFSPLTDPGKRAEAIAKSYLLQKNEQMNFASADIESTDWVTQKHSKDINVVQAKQTIDDVELFGKQMRVLINGAGHVIAASGQLANQAELRLLKQEQKNSSSTNSEHSRVSQQDALAIAATELGAESMTGKVFKYNKTAGKYTYYQAVQGSDIHGMPRIKDVYYDMGDSIEAAYYLEVAVNKRDRTLITNAQEFSQILNNSRAPLRYFSYVISKNNGQVLYRKNLKSDFQYRAFVDNTGVPLDSPIGDISPFTLSFEAEQPSLIQAPLVSLNHGPISTEDPWLLEGTKYTVGNNVFALANLALFERESYDLSDIDENGMDAEGNMLGITSSHDVFDYVFDDSLPMQTFQNRQAAITHVFYATNWLHDWFYDAGFDEQAGNAQQDNYGRGGLENDGMFVGLRAPFGVGSATMFTPADGENPYMSLGLFHEKPIEQGVTFSLTVNVDGENIEVAAFPTNNSVRKASFSDESISVVRYVFDANATSCKLETDFPENLSSAVLIDVDYACYLATDSDFGFTIDIVNELDIVEEVIAQGAETVLYTVTSDSPVSSFVFAELNSSREKVFDKPVFIVFQDDLLELDGWGDDTIRHPINGFIDLGWRDSALDFDVISHEYGHYVHNRLIGDGSGLINNQGRSLAEGWSDFHTLLTSVRPEDTGIPGNQIFEGIYSTGSYVTNDFYFGVRRVPYSTDMNINALTFKHIEKDIELPDSHPVQFGQDGSGNNLFHSSGEVWANILWESYVKLLTERGISFNDAQIRMRDYLIISYKMTPSSPTYTEARDALLAAVYANDQEDYRLFLEAFAKRGMGFGAKSPERFDTEHRGVVESFKPEAALIESGNLSMNTQYLARGEGYCSNDDVWDVGETVELSAVIMNKGSETLFNVKGSFESLSDIAFENNGFVVIPSLRPFEQKEIRLRARLTSASFRENITIKFDVVSAVAEKNDVELSETLKISSEVNYAFQREISTDGIAINDFEDPTAALAQWQLSWQWGQSESALINPFYVVQDESGNYQLFGEDNPLDSSYAFESLWFSALDDAEQVVLTFDHAFDFDSAFGGLIILSGGALEVRTRDSEWQDVEAFGGTLAGGYTEEIFLFDFDDIGTTLTLPVFAGVGAPSREEVDFGTLLAGKEFQFRFRIFNQASSSASGWTLDNIQISGVNEGFVEIIPETQSCYFGSSYY